MQRSTGEPVTKTQFSTAKRKMNRPAYTTQRSAKRQLRVTGKTLKEIDAMVAKLRTEKRGSRDKVFQPDVDRLIAIHSQPPVIDTTIRPISQKVRERWFGQEAR